MEHKPLINIPRRSLGKSKVFTRSCELVKLSKYPLINHFIICAANFSCLAYILGGSSVLALPPENDIPEEVLATEIIIQGRSSFDNQPLSASEYATQKEDNSESIFPPDVNSELKHAIFLLRVLKMLRTFTPIK